MIYIGSIENVQIIADKNRRFVQQYTRRQCDAFLKKVNANETFYTVCNTKLIKEKNRLCLVKDTQLFLGVFRRKKHVVSQEKTQQPEAEN